MTTYDDPFEQFLLRCEPDLSSSAERHRRLRAKLIKFFGWKRCDDPEGLADETIGRLIAVVYAEATIENPSGFARGTAVNVFRENLRRTARVSQIDEDADIAGEAHQADSDPDSFDSECAELCLRKLSDDKRRLLEQYYSEEWSREELVRHEGISVAALRTKIHRLKVELKKCYQDCIQAEGAFKRN